MYKSKKPSGIPIAITMVISFVIGHIIGEGKPVEFEYSTLDEYYIECRSLHGGTGRVIMYNNREAELFCADGHSPDDARHEAIEITQLIKESPYE